MKWTLLMMQCLHNHLHVKQRTFLPTHIVSEAMCSPIQYWVSKDNLKNSDTSDLKGDLLSHVLHFCTTPSPLYYVDIRFINTFLPHFTVCLHSWLIFPFKWSVDSICRFFVILFIDTGLGFSLCSKVDWKVKACDLTVVLQPSYCQRLILNDLVCFGFGNATGVNARLNCFHFSSSP